MRPAALIIFSASVTLASCMSTSDTHSRRDAPRSRLARLHEQSTLNEVLIQSEILADATNHTLAHELRSGTRPNRITGHSQSKWQEPEQATARGRAIKQQAQRIQGPGDKRSYKHAKANALQHTPERTGNGLRPWRLRWQPLEISLNHGIGDVMVRSDGSRLGDRTDAAFAQIKADGGHGAGLHAEWWDSDSTLFSGKFMNDGVVPKVADAELGGVDLFPHLRFDYQYGEWHIPVRIGLFADWHQLDHQEARVEREWLSFGPRILIEPTLTMFHKDDGDIHLFGRIGGDLGTAWFSEEFRNGDEKDIIPRWACEIGAGIRGTYGSWHAEISYRLQHTMYGETQGQLFGNPGRTELQRQQLFFGIGFTY